MTRGLVRNNNLSDLADPVQARINLGLATADYNRIRGLFTSAGVSHVDVQRIARASSNYQQQITSIISTLFNIVPSNYVALSGGTITSGWTNTGFIRATSFITNGVVLSGSTDSLFTLTVSGFSFAISTSSIVCNLGLTVSSLVDNGNMQLSSGVTVNKLARISVNGRPFFIEVG